MIDTTYGDVTRAYGALTALSRQGMQLQFAVVLKWKRILGVLRPLVQQAEELQQELLEVHAKRDDDSKPIVNEQTGAVKLTNAVAYNKAVTEMLRTPVTVGSDLVAAADFGDQAAQVNSNVAELLMELGPFCEA